jgi:hypothetical protein
MLRFLLNRITQFDEWRGAPDGRPTFWIKKLWTWRGFSLQLHRFVGADDPGCFHTHPAWALRLVLSGGYVEEVGDGRWRTWWPGRLGIVSPDFEHRVAGLRNGRESWSLWLRGPKIAAIGIRGCE